MYIIPIIATFVAFGAIAVQLWTGVAITGWGSEKTFVERASRPSIYWFIIALETFAAVAVSIASFAMAFTQI